MNPKISTLLKVVAAVLLAGFILPFVVLAFYGMPVSDDFLFTDYTNTHGYFGAQIYWYLTWTGRYFSTAILSFSPWVLQSDWFYHLGSVAMIALTAHSLWFLVREIAPSLSKSLAAILAGMAFVAYLMMAPDITSAFYWFAGSATYQLPSALVAYLIGLTFRFERTEDRKTRNRLIPAMAFVAFAAVGCNEVTMATLSVGVALYVALSMLFTRKWIQPRQWVLAATAMGAILLVFAPGNTERAKGDMSDRELNHIGEAWQFAYADTRMMFAEWDWSLLLPLILVSALVFAVETDRKPSATWAVKAVALMVFVAFLAVLVVFPTYHIYSHAPPPRTVNFAVWIVVLGALSAGWLVAPLVKNFVGTRPVVALLAAIAVVVLASFANPTNNVSRAYADLFYSSAADYREEVLARRAQVRNCTDSVCVVPAYSNYPHSLFHSDLDRDEKQWYNTLYAKYNNAKAISVDYSVLQPVLSAALHFEPAEAESRGYASAQLVDSVYFRGSHTFHMTPETEFVGSISFRIDTLELRDGHDLAHLRVEASAMFVDSSRDIHVVSVINREGKSLPVNWMSTTWEEPRSQEEGWQIVELWVPLYELDLKESDTFSVYLWNPYGRDAYIDELTVSVY